MSTHISYSLHQLTMPPSIPTISPHRHLHRRAIGVRKGGAEDVGRMLPGDVARVASRVARWSGGKSWCVSGKPAKKHGTSWEHQHFSWVNRHFNMGYLL